MAITRLDYMDFLRNEIKVLESRFAPEDTGHIRTAVNVLKERYKEVRAEVEQSEQVMMQFFD
jgi:hypothetical protein